MTAKNSQKMSLKDAVVRRGTIWLGMAFVSVASVACANPATDFTQLTFQAAESHPVSESVSPQTLTETQAILEERLAKLGIEGALVAVEAPDRIVVDLPNSSDTNSADTDLIEQSLIRNEQLAFRRQRADATGDLYELKRTIESLVEQQARSQLTQQQADALQREIDEAREAVVSLFGPAEITGAQVAEAVANPMSANPTNSTEGLWQIDVRFDDEGERRFAEITKQTAGTGRSIGIFVGDQLISAPSVSVEYAETGILGGRASLSTFSAEEAMMLALQLNSGELPLQLQLLSITVPEPETSEPDETTED